MDEVRVKEKAAEGFQPKPRSFNGTKSGSTLSEMQDSLEMTIGKLVTGLNGRQVLQWAAVHKGNFDKEAARAAWGAKAARIQAVDRL